jgi:peptide deformylase
VVIPQNAGEETMKHLDYCTHWQFQEDRAILTRPSFDVNMRLFHANIEYRRLVQECFDYILRCAIEHKEGYKQPHGWSGPNAGIPFNIIAVPRRENDCARIGMINPKITRWSGYSKKVKTNCGSLTLDEPVETSRDPSIDVEWMDRTGTRCMWRNVGPKPGYTIQHEVEHCQGILIRTDRKIP